PESREEAWWGRGGVFNAGLINPYLEGVVWIAVPTDCWYLVPTTLDQLHLQSVGARLAEATGRPPQSGYLRVAAVGSDVDVAAVRSFGRMPILIDNDGGTYRQRFWHALNFQFISLIPPLATFLARFQSAERAASAFTNLIAKRRVHTRPYD